jgi:acyl-CoA thioesterase
VDDRTEAINDYIRQDPFARFLGADVEIPKPGHARVTLTVTDDMLNFHGSTHGGLIFAMGDMAFAAASNSHGRTAVALNVAINFLRATTSGDRLVAEAVEESESGPVALYDITVRNDRTGAIVARSQNLVYRKKEWFVPDTAGQTP